MIFYYSICLDNYAHAYMYKTKKNDWVAVFWKEEKFECLGIWTIEFSYPRTDSQLYWKPQAACFTALRDKTGDENKIIVVATTHLIFNNNRGDQKLAQLDLVMKWFSQIKQCITRLKPDCQVSLSK